jgi:thioredoxin-dependent peroxiredoxin
VFVLLPEGRYAWLYTTVVFITRPCRRNWQYSHCGNLPGQVGETCKFDNKYSLGFSLLADTEHIVAEAFGVWKEKMLYGKTYMGIERSSFLIGVDGRVEQAWYKISPRDTPVKLLEALS